MALQEDLAYATAGDLADRIRRRDLSAVEVMDATIARIEARDPSLNAFTHKAFDEARAAASEADRRLAAGEEVGPLHGVPTALKDLFDFKPGWPATFGGVRALRDFRPDWQCSWCERMVAAGAIPVGKTNAPVMGFRGTCDNYLFGPGRNPFDTSRDLSQMWRAAAAAAGALALTAATCLIGGRR